MKEFTIVTTVQVTEIVQADRIYLLHEREVEHNMKRCFDADDVKITNRQIFIRDLPNN